MTEHDGLAGRSRGGHHQIFALLSDSVTEHQQGLATLIIASVDIAPCLFEGESTAVALFVLGVCRRLASRA